ncbi:39S ribosomal protein L45, partial [Desulfovibrio sp. OttesenSCG-928-O18]|nr:39S ribosomal protein L45 [Desulfovibrio sp. OttesenSCG-928-O18]
MRKRIVTMCCLVLAAMLLCLHAGADDAAAARLGGGKSFGGKPSYSRSAPAPASAQRPPGAAARQNPAAMPGQRSGMRGMLGGILAGTLLGSLLFGGAHAGPGVVDIVFFALLAFFALKLVRAVMNRRAASAESGPGAGYARERGPDPWQKMRGAAEGPAEGYGSNPAGAAGAGGGAGAGPDISLPGFDQQDFLRGAKILFTRLQDAWDKRDMEDIAAFATPAIFREIEAQAEADPAPSVTEILLVNASLVAAERDGENEVVTVFFDALVRENPEAETPAQVRELW